MTPTQITIKKPMRKAFVGTIRPCLRKTFALSQSSHHLVGRSYSIRPFSSSSIDTNVAGTNHFDDRNLSVAGRETIRQILKKLQERNYFVTLPEDKLTAILIPLFAKLGANGLTTDFLIAECSRNDHFLQLLLSKFQEDLFEICKVLTTYCSLTYEEIFLMLKSIEYDISHSGGDVGVSGRLDVLLNLSGVEYGRNLGQLVLKCPPLIFAQDPEKINEIFNALRSFFTKKQLVDLVQYTPQILVMNFEELEQKYEYIFYHMGLGGEDFLGCKSWIEMSLEEMMLRHSCLVKSGRYHFPDPKAPQLRKENPEMSKIFDSSDEHFSTKIAGISLEEWNVFKMIERRAREEEDRDEPYVKVKPSLRKKFERQKKATIEKPSEFVFGAEIKDQF
ncbi:unnamed protein product, partial [Mesorhabditis belari]|uniref:Uncharacterized protein n=1 Tax=Mesorhabditis belari TaxID=2138241 RepID=A0AAF3EFS3_9BILA